MKLPKRIAALLTVTLVTSNTGYSSFADSNQRVSDDKLVGAGRWETAIEVSKKGWTSSNEAIIVNDNSIADALAATPFADAKKAPILLIGKDKLDERTKAELNRLGVKKVYLIGGTNVLSKNIEDELKAQSLEVDRIAGNTRELTAIEIAKRLDKIKDIEEIAVVNGTTGLADAVSIAAVAADKDMAIILSNPNNGTKDSDEFIKNEDIQTSYIIGGEKAVSKEVESKLPNAERIEGLDRNETNAKVIETFYTERDINNAYVAKDGMGKEDQLIDALSVGVLAAKNHSPVVIVGNKLNQMQKDVTNTKSFKTVTQVGGNGNEAAFSELKDMQGVTTYEVKTVKELNDALAKADANDVINVRSLNETTRSSKVEIASKNAVKINLHATSGKSVVVNVTSGTLEAHGTHSSIDVKGGDLVIKGEVKTVNILEGGEVKVDNKGTSKPNITVEAQASVEVTGTVNAITVSGKDASVSVAKDAVVSKIEVSKDASGAVLATSGKVETITVNGKDAVVNVTKDAVVSKVEVNKEASGAVIDNDGKVDKVDSNADDVTIENSGTVGNVSGNPTVDNSGGGTTGGSTGGGSTGGSSPSTPTPQPPSDINVTDVSINKDIETVEVGKTVQLIATVNPDNATNKDVTWSSSDESVATVDANGLVSGVKAGNVIITVTTKDGNKTADCEVTVTLSEDEINGKKVEELINNLPSLENLTLTDENKANIIAARNAYEGLNESAKKYVSNLDKLTSLESKITREESIKKFQQLKEWKLEMEELKTKVDEEISKVIDIQIAYVEMGIKFMGIDIKTINIDNNTVYVSSKGKSYNLNDAYVDYNTEVEISNAIDKAIERMNKSDEFIQGKLAEIVDQIIGDGINIPIGSYTVENITIPAGMNKENTIDVLADLLTVKDFEININPKTGLAEIPSDKLDLEKLETLLEQSIQEDVKVSIENLITLIKKMPPFILNINWNTDNFSSELNKPSSVDANISISLNLKDIIDLATDPITEDIINSLVKDQNIDLSFIKSMAEYLNIDLSKYNVGLGYTVGFEFDVKDIALNTTVNLPTLKLPEEMDASEVNKILDEIANDYVETIIGGKSPLLFKVYSDWSEYTDESTQLEGTIRIQLNDIIVINNKTIVPIERVNVTEYVEGVIEQIKSEIEKLVNENQIKEITRKLEELKAFIDKVSNLNDEEKKELQQKIEELLQEISQEIYQ